MTDSRRKSKPLADVLARYESAQFGDLNRTADELRAACAEAGWRWNLDGPGFRSWAIAKVRGGQP